MIRVQILTNWCDSRQIADQWNKMSQGNYTWNNIRIVWSGNVDYYVVINGTQVELTSEQKKRTIIFQMEPYMEWYNPKDFLKVCKHETEYNNNEWHLSKTFQELTQMIPEKTQVLSTVLSAKYYDPGHIKRVDFVKFLDKKGLSVHVYGCNLGYREYKGGLPLYCKDDGLFPYKYTFNVENHNIRNYYTEKLIDGILAECLVFYSGCPNVGDYIDERAFVYLELEDFEKDYDIIEKAIREDWWEKRLLYIRKAKEKILQYLQFFPRLERILVV